MARLIEIKGLGADIAAVKKGIGELRAAATELNTEKSGLTAEIKDLTEQLKQHRADLRFEAETLGNSSGDTDTEETKVVSTASAVPLKGIHGTVTPEMEAAISDRVALGASPAWPEAMTEVVVKIDPEPTAGQPTFMMTEVEQQPAATFRAAE